jgi:hypothetical protein
MYHAPWATPGGTLFWCNLCIMCYATREGLHLTEETGIKTTLARWDDRRKIDDKYGMIYK